MTVNLQGMVNLGGMVNPPVTAGFWVAGSADRDVRLKGEGGGQYAGRLAPRLF